MFRLIRNIIFHKIHIDFYNYSMCNKAAKKKVKGFQKFNPLNLEIHFENSKAEIHKYIHDFIGLLQ